VRPIETGHELRSFLQDTRKDAEKPVIDGFRFRIDVCDPRRLARPSGGAARKGAETITAPMPGKVVRVLVAPGATVAAGDVLATIG
jgi:biotin carboxyl carrier protein